MKMFDTEEKKRYWAVAEPDELVQDLNRKTSGYYQYLSTVGLGELWTRAQRTYYGFDVDGWNHRSSIVSSGGAQGEYSLLQINHFRSFLQHIHTMATQNRPAFMAHTINDDPASRAQADVAQGVLEYYMTQKNLEKTAVDAQERCLVKGEGFVWMYWDPEMVNDGQTSETGEDSGDVVFRDIDPDYVVRDPYVPWEEKRWCTVRNVENRWDLVSRYPELEKEILNISTKTYSYSGSDVLNEEAAGAVAQDHIDVFYFYHERCPSLPEGRHMIFAGDVVFYSGPLPFAKIPLYRTSPGDILDTAFGYSPAFDLLGLQTSYDAMFSAELSTYDALGIQNIMIDEGSEIYPEQIRDGLNFLSVPQGYRDPRPLQLAQPPVGLPAFRQQIEMTMERVSGINSVVRGDPAQSLGKGAPGSAIALLQNQALQFNSRFQRSYYNLLEDLGSGLFDMLKRFATGRRVALIVGKDEEYKIKYFNMKEMNINRVSVKVGNAMENTLQGRFAMIETLAPHGLLKEPQDAFQILEYGRMRSAYKDQEAQNLLIQKENEQLLEGPEVLEDGSVVGVPVLLTDDHRRHIAKHTEEILTNLDARNDPEIIKATLAHITAHVDILKEADPAVLMAMGQPSLQMEQAAALGQAGAPPEGADVGGTAPEGGDNDTPEGAPQGEGTV